MHLLNNFDSHYFGIPKSLLHRFHLTSIAAHPAFCYTCLIFGVFFLICPCLFFIHFYSMYKRITEDIEDEVGSIKLVLAPSNSLLTFPRQWFWCGSILPVCGVRVSVVSHLMFIHYNFTLVWVAEWPPFGKYLLTRLAFCSHLWFLVIFFILPSDVPVYCFWLLSKWLLSISFHSQWEVMDFSLLRTSTRI